MVIISSSIVALLIVQQAIFRILLSALPASDIAKLALIHQLVFLAFPHITFMVLHVWQTAVLE